MMSNYHEADSRHAARLAERQATLDRSRERAMKMSGVGRDTRCTLCGATGHRAPSCPMRGALNQGRA